MGSREWIPLEVEFISLHQVHWVLTTTWHLLLGGTNATGLLFVQDVHRYLWKLSHLLRRVPPTRVICSSIPAHFATPGKALSVATLPIPSIYQPEANSQESAKGSYLSSLWFISWLFAFIKKKSKQSLLLALLSSFVVKTTVLAWVCTDAQNEWPLLMVSTFKLRQSSIYMSNREFSRAV